MACWWGGLTEVGPLGTVAIEIQSIRIPEDSIGANTKRQLRYCSITVGIIMRNLLAFRKAYPPNRRNTRYAQLRLSARLPYRRHYSL